MKNLKYLMFIALITLFVGCGDKDTDATNPDNPNNGSDPVIEEQKIEDKVKDTTLTEQDGLIFSDIKITENGAMNIVSAKVKNTGSESRTFTAILYMKDPSDKILGKVDKLVKDLAVNATEEISIEIMGDYSSLSSFEVKIK